MPFFSSPRIAASPEVIFHCLVITLSLLNFELSQLFIEFPRLLRFHFAQNLFRQSSSFLLNVLSKTASSLPPAMALGAGRRCRPHPPAAPCGRTGRCRSPCRYHKFYYSLFVLLFCVMLCIFLLTFCVMLCII